ncbi:hypothetical protein HRbin18_01591 [bacterium HR18]|nr:hypothetical protein HRbin18_01591 [bacterium HR18]
MHYFTVETPYIRLKWEGPCVRWGVPLVVEARLLEGCSSVTVYPAPDAPGLAEQTSYRLLLESRDGHPVALRHVNPALLRGLDVLYAGRLWHGTLQFGTHVGRTDFVVWHNERPHLCLEVEVFPTRITYRADYEAMLADLEAFASELALRYGSGFWKRGQPEPDRTVLGTSGWVALLQAHLEALAQAFVHIRRRPLTSMVRMRTWQPLEVVRYPDPMLHRSLVARGGQGAETQLLGYRVRRWHSVPHSTTTTDTPENRWLTWQLIQTHHLLEQVRAHLAFRSAPARQQALHALGERLDQLRAYLPPASIRATPPPPTQRLFRAEGYRQAYRIFQQLRRGLSLLEGLLQFEVGQVHELYEYWCYLTLLRQLSRQTGCPISWQSLLKEGATGLDLRLWRRRGLSFPLPGGGRIRVVYNPRWSARKLLVPQQPDLLLSCYRPGRCTVHYVLDAKYRVETSPGYVRRYGVPGPPAEALNDLHRYRDALSAYFMQRDGSYVAQALVLYPYREGEAGTFAGSRLARAAFEEAVGALPLLPGFTVYLEAWLERVLRQDQGVHRTVSSGTK